MRPIADTLIYGPAWILTIAIGAIALFLPNSRRLARNLRHGRWLNSTSGRAAPARPAIWMPAMIVGALLYFAIASIGTLQSKFIYFNF